MKYASSGSSSAPGGSIAGGAVTGMAVAGTGAASHIVDVDITQMKQIGKPPPPRYPPLAKLAHIQGTVIVEMIVGTDGVPTNVTTLSGPAQLRAVAEAYALAMRFEPSLVNGVPQTTRFTLTMPFRLN